MRILYIAILGLATATAAADEVKSLAEAYMLPPYCSGTQHIRTITHDPRSINEYMAIYGHTYYYLHHYCWALNTVNHVMLMEDQYLRNSKLTYALHDIQFVLDRAAPNFILLPEIYASRARILFMLKRDAEAATSLIKAIDAKPDYVPAIARLSDFYAENGDKDKAIKILEQGIDHTKRADRLIEKLKQLGVVYQGHLQNDNTPKVEAGEVGSEPTASAQEEPPVDHVTADNPAPLPSK
jgi:tetratricopeptide (TPR) repeat protein